MPIVVGIDLGTCSTLVYIKGKGIIIKEPSLVAYDRDSNKVKAFGEEARLILGRTPGNIIAVHPLKHGVISDYTVTEQMIKFFIQKALGRMMFQKPKISISVPSGATEVERKAVEEAAYAAGARDVYVVEEPLAAALGAGLDITKAFGNMIVDIGGGTTDIAVTSLRGTVANASIQVAGDDLDDAIMKYLRRQYNLIIGERTAEDVKIKIGSAYQLVEEEQLEVGGRDMATGLPKTVTVSSREMEDVLRDITGQMITAIISVLEQIPPELAADILDRGILLTGGGALLRGLDELIEERTGIHTLIAEEPMLVVARGAGEYQEIMERKEF